MEALFAKVHRAIHLSKECKDFLESNLCISLIAKGEIISQPGKCNIAMAFVDSGFLHSYHPFRANGPTNRFFVPGDLYISPEITLRPTDDIEYTQALQDTFLYYLGHEFAQKACEDYPDFCQFITFLNLENNLREVGLMRMEEMDTIERYQWLIDHFDGGDTLHRQYIAFYIGLPAERIKALKRRDYRRKARLLKSKP